MNLNREIARILRLTFYSLGIDVQISMVAASTLAALRRVARRDVKINTVIDIGASNGSWSAEAMRFFPDANYLLVEAQSVHQPELDRFVMRHRKAQYVLKAAGEAEGVIYFDANDAFGGQALNSASGGRIVQVPVTSIDDEIEARSLSGPFLIKFDVHGYELPILAGAKKALKNTNLIVMECYNFQIAPGALLFHDMCAHMQKLGFRVVDISEPRWRPRDRAFWQADIFFVPETNPEFAIDTYV